MSALRSLTRGYGSFFWGAAEVAVCPYTETFLAVAKPDTSRLRREGESDNLAGNVLAGVAVCGILTFVVPILPVLTSFTMTLASIAFSLALMSMFITYPVALLMDVCSLSDNRVEYSSSF